MTSQLTKDVYLCVFSNVLIKLVHSVFRIANIFVNVLENTKMSQPLRFCEGHNIDPP